ncbi:MAG: ArsR/SmtB family transcription factor [Candidatus Thorarchaeota archaeon]
MKTGLNEICYRFFSTLSNPTRLAILELLSEGSKKASEIHEALGLEQSMVSHNLRTLLRCRFVIARRRGREHVYSVNRETMEPLFHIVETHRQQYCPTLGQCFT